MKGKPWSETEVELIVADYFEMLLLEIRGVGYNKSEYRRALQAQLDGRSDGSIERKHQNISAIMIEQEIPYISGYKPLSNYQRALLPEVIRSYLQRFPEVAREIEKDATAATDPPIPDNILGILQPPPERVRREETYEDRPSQPFGRIVSPFDYLRREAANQVLGRQGESLILEYEKSRLVDAGKASLAEKVEHSSVVHGDGLGYDIRSYETNGTDRFIEAKTTKYGKNTPFYVTRNELEVSREFHRSYWLYRLFQFRTEPQLFQIAGALNQTFLLKPTMYVAVM